MTNYVCAFYTYHYRGYTFEITHSGPWPLRKDGMPWERSPSSAFWDAMREWEDLSDDEKKRTSVCGGCVRF